MKFDSELANLDARAEDLVESQLRLMEELIALRKKHGLSQEVVGERMGISQPAVASFEAYDSNPTLSSIRRYALAVGASIQHVVRDEYEIIELAGLGHSQIEEWLAQPTVLLDIDTATTSVSQTING